MDLLEFVPKAPCAKADPWLFDQHQIDLALQGLTYCQRCPFWTECDELVKPKQSHYDGIASGKVWRNGKVLARLHETSPSRLIVCDEREDLLDAETVGFCGSEL